MKQAKYNMISGGVFMLIAICTIVSIGFGYEMSSGGVEIPLYVEYALALLSLILAYSAVKLLK